MVCRLRASELAATALYYLSREQIILIGTRMGGIRAYKYPINSRSDYQENFTQCGAITQVIIRFIITVIGFSFPYSF